MITGKENIYASAAGTKDRTGPSIFNNNRSGHSAMCVSFFGMLVLLVFLVGSVQAQQYDMLLKGGHVIDPKNGIDRPMDVAVTNRTIARVAADISASEAVTVVDVTGLYVTPGLVDMHVHVSRYTPRGFDGFTFRAGVTTVVDGGSFGWRNFHRMEEYVENTRTRVLAFIDIVGSKGTPPHSSSTLVLDESDRDPAVTASKIDRYSDVIVGIKTWKAPSFDGIERAVEAGNLADVPVMIDLGSHDPPLSLETLLMDKLRPGDIFTHTYSRQYYKKGREPVVDEDGQVKPFIYEAQERGIVFGVGHGGGSLQWPQVVPAMKQGFHPDVISTDLHHGSMNGGMKNMTNVMSKFLILGMPLQEVVEASTWKPARVIGREERGHLSEGAEADIAVLNLREGDFGFLDSRGRALQGDQKLEAELTLLGGRVVWDLNGIAAPMWDEVLVEPLRF